MHEFFYSDSTFLLPISEEVKCTCVKMVKGDQILNNTPLA